MKQKDKELLLKDLCARLPYGVMVNVKGFDFDFNSKLVQIYKGGRMGCSFEVTNGMPYDIDEIKPYLYPQSSMTEEQIAQLEFWAFMKEYHKITDFYYENHIDFRGLIEKSLALDATGLNIY